MGGATVHGKTKYVSMHVLSQKLLYLRIEIKNTYTYRYILRCCASKAKRHVEHMTLYDFALKNEELRIDDVTHDTVLNRLNFQKNWIAANHSRLTSHLLSMSIQSKFTYVRWDTGPSRVRTSAFTCHLECKSTWTGIIGRYPVQIRTILDKLSDIDLQQSWSRDRWWPMSYRERLTRTCETSIR